MNELQELEKLPEFEAEQTITIIKENNGEIENVILVTFILQANFSIEKRELEVDILKKEIIL